MTDDVREYLVGYGAVGDFGRFRPVHPIDAQRGDRTVVRTARGLEMGVVLCEARPGHARFLPNTTVGTLLRLASPEDERQAERMRDRGQALHDDAQRRGGDQALPLEVLDVEVLLDGEQAVLHYLAWAPFDERTLVGPLSSAHDLRLTLHSLAVPVPEEEHEHGCGREGCGRTSGGCGTCGTCGSCGTGTAPDLKAHFLELRQKMLEQNGGRVPLA